VPRKIHHSYRDGQRQHRGRITKRRKHIGATGAIRRVGFILKEVQGATLVNGQVRPDHKLTRDL
jgi:hypothetical protein